MDIVVFVGAVELWKVYCFVLSFQKIIVNRKG